jgi:hypothetical protein
MGLFEDLDFAGDNLIDGKSIITLLGHQFPFLISNTAYWVVPLFSPHGTLTPLLYS